jgi:hypothetical protein
MILYPQNILLQKRIEISFLEIFGYRIGYKYPLIYILPVSGLKSLKKLNLTNVYPNNNKNNDNNNNNKVKSKPLELYELAGTVTIEQ